MPRYRVDLTALAMVRASVVVVAADRASAEAAATSETELQGVVWEYMGLDQAEGSQPAVVACVEEEATIFRYTNNLGVRDVAIPNGARAEIRAQAASAFGKHTMLAVEGLGLVWVDGSRLEVRERLGGRG
jgi:hypothetical protein